MQDIHRVGDHVIQNELKAGIPGPTPFRRENRLVIENGIPGQPFIQLPEGPGSGIQPGLVDFCVVR